METTFRNWLSLFASPRGSNVLLGAWLFASAFVLPHSFDSALISALLGVLIMVASVAQFAASEARYLDPILAAILAVSAIALPGVTLVTRVNQGGVALAVFVLSRIHGMHAIRRQVRHAGHA
jgi:hypothetical protein